jgi:hypothetical protein
VVKGKVDEHSGRARLLGLVCYLVPFVSIAGNALPTSGRDKGATPLRTLCEPDQLANAYRVAPCMSDVAQ